MAVGSHHHPPVLILAARIVDEERFCVVKEEDPAEHILTTEVPDKFRMAPSISHRNTEMVVALTDVIGNPWLCASKHKNP